MHICYMYANQPVSNAKGISNMSSQGMTKIFTESVTEAHPVWPGNFPTRKEENNIYYNLRALHFSTVL